MYNLIRPSPIPIDLVKVIPYALIAIDNPQVFRITLAELDSTYILFVPSMKSLERLKRAARWLGYSDSLELKYLTAQNAGCVVLKQEPAIP